MRAKKTQTGIRRDQIVGAALEEIGEHGVSALSISGIAERVGIVPSAIYRHFEGKDAVLEAILEHLNQRLMGNVSRARKEESGSCERLRLLMALHLKMFREFKAIPYILFSDGMYAGHPERRQKIFSIMESYLKKVKEIIAEGIQERAIRPDVDPQTASMMFLGVIVPGAILWHMSAGRFDVSGHAEKAWPAFRDYLAAR